MATRSDIDEWEAIFGRLAALETNDQAVAQLRLEGADLSQQLEKARRAVANKLITAQTGNSRQWLVFSLERRLQHVTDELRKWDKDRDDGITDAAEEPNSGGQAQEEDAIPQTAAKMQEVRR